MEITVLSFCRKAGYRPELAWTCCYADMLSDRDGMGDGAKAMPLLDECLAISSELGMRPLIERVISQIKLIFLNMCPLGWLGLKYGTFRASTAV